MNPEVLTLQTYYRTMRKYDLGQPRREMEGTFELAQEQDFGLIMAKEVARYTTLYEFLNISQTSKGCSKHLRRQTFLK